MDIVWTIVIGLAVGIIAKLLTPGNAPMGLALTALLGIAGAFVASFLGQFVGIYKPGETAGFIGAIVGAVIVLYVWGLIARRKQA